MERHVPESEQHPLRYLVKELDRLLDVCDLPEEIKEAIWTLLTDVNEYRRQHPEER